jgi:hypothetical protein
MVLAFDQCFELFIPGPDFILQRGDDFISLLFDGVLKLGKLVLNAEEVVLEFLEDGVCLLSDYSID